MITMPKVERSAPSAHRNSISAASAAGGGTRSSSWTPRDDETLKAARAQGLNWNQIAPKHFPSKTANACRKRHERLMERQNADQWNGGVKLDELATAYFDVRREMWKILAERVGEKWQLVEAKCMEKGMKNLSQAYRASQKRNSEREDRMPSATLSDIPESTYSPYQATYSAQHVQHAQHSQQRVPSIQNMLQPYSGPNPHVQH